MGKKLNFLKKWIYLCLLVEVVFFYSTPASYAGITTEISEVTPIQPGSAYSPRMLGLFIGINDYSDPAWHDLKFPKKDVEDMVAFFTDNQTLSLDYKIVLTNPTETTRNNILFNVFDTFSLQNSLEEDIVFVYISSHGTVGAVNGLNTNKNNEQLCQYFVTSDTIYKKEADSAIAVDRIRAWFDKLRSKRKVLILDMCHSGLGKSQISPEIKDILHSSKGLGFEPEKDSLGSIVLSSSKMGGTSYEIGELNNSVYTYFLLEGMKQGDLNRDGAITISEAHNYACDKTIKYTNHFQGGAQIPTAYSKILGKDPIYVNGIPKAKGDPTLFSYSSSNSDVDVYVDNIYKGTLPKGVRVKSGKREIECKKNGTTIYNVTLIVKPGASYLLPEFFIKTYTVNKEKLLFLESGYLTYGKESDTEKITPDGPLLGASVYYNGIFDKPWSLTGGFNYARKENIRTISASFGLKYLIELNNAAIYLGPEVMVLNYEYPSKQIENYRVDDRVSFICPGLEISCSYKFDSGYCLLTGVKSHYIKYKLSDASNEIFSHRFFIGTGYAF